MNDFVSIASFDELNAAEKLAARLAESGFEARARNEGRDHFWAEHRLQPRAHCHVLVPKADGDAALRWLADFGSAEYLQSAVRCPACGSTETEFPHYASSGRGALHAAVAAAGLIEPDFYCKRCHLTWPPADEGALRRAASGK